MATIDTSFLYALDSEFLKDQYWLDGQEPLPQKPTDGVLYAARMMVKDTSFAASQQWRIIKEGDGYSLSTVYSGAGYFLTASGDVAEVRLEERTEANKERQLWDFIDMAPNWEIRNRSIKDAYLESNHPVKGENKVKGEPVPLTLTNIVGNGKRWRLTKLDAVAPAAAVRPHPDRGGWTETGNFGTQDSTKPVRCQVVFLDLVKDSSAEGSSDVKVVEVAKGDGRAEKIQAAKTKSIDEVEAKQAFTEMSGGVNLELDYREGVVLVADPRKFLNSFNDWADPSSYMAKAKAAFDAYEKLDAQATAPTTALTSTPSKTIFTTCMLKNGVSTMGRGGTQVIIGTDAYDADYRLFLHEVLHTFSLPDLYPLKGGHRVGAWDLMADARQATSLLGWHRIRVGWVDPKSPRLATLKSVTSATRHVLMPWSGRAGVSTVLVQLGTGAETETEVWCIELGNKVSGNPPKRPGSTADVGSPSMLKPDASGVIVYRVTSAPANDRRELEIMLPKEASNEDLASKWDLFETAIVTDGSTLDAQLPFQLRIGKQIGRGFEITVGPKAGAAKALEASG